MDEQIDRTYEFNAPKFIDFLQGDVDEDADKWFDERTGDEGGIDIDMVPYYENAMESGGFQKATSAISAALAQNVMETGVGNNTTPIPAAVEKMDVSPAKTVFTSESQSGGESDNQHEYSVMSNTRTVPRSNIRTSWNSPARIKLKQSPHVRRSQPHRIVNQNVNYCEAKKRKATSTSDSTVLLKKPKVEQKRPSIPETPSFVRKLRQRSAKKGPPSSEAMAVRKMQELQKQTREQLKRNDKRLKDVLGASSYLPSRSICPVTKPKEFSFATDTRVKDHPMQTRSNCKPFENQLRQHPPSPPIRKEVTKPKPFHFQSSGKTTTTKSAGPMKAEWQSTAHLAMQFQTKTPERFHVRRKNSESESLLPLEVKKPQLTQAKTPNLSTKSRSRPVSAISREEMDAKEADSIAQYQFKATEFNQKIVEKKGMYGVKCNTEPLQATKVKPFHFASDSRIEQRKLKEEPAKVTRNNSLTNTKDTRGARTTEIKPFSFENRDKERLSKKEEKIKGILQEEEKMHEFHARPLPSFSPDFVPTIVAKQHTHPVPFKISHGSTSYQQKLQDKRRKELELERANRQFKAQPADVVHKEPFKPVGGLIPPTDATNITLNSDIRAKERMKFEEWKHEQELTLETEKMRIEKERMVEEEKELKRLRLEQVHRAQPVRSYKPLHIEQSAKPLTMPHTPNLQAKKRSMRL